MHQPCSDPPPSRMETVDAVAAALVEVRETNRCLAPDDRINEETFVLGAIRLYVGEADTPCGHALASLAGQIKAYASNWK